ncbi:TIGR03943 family putative permease subunit [Maledivibacter halophilus]|uniref:Putative membrane protein n=1 Tax=Maledivibacter halophilus TaxID=36842 RepID=A0A1T5LYW4_9FIRM|nr:TIGR03943 family protein [Maledivibacter halophilus]SKC81196.1 putative membrane protein [Maledivibacter halophilus]
MRKFNINEFIWFIILVSFTYYIYQLFDTGRINIYLHPKMFKYVLFSLIIFTLLSIFQIRKIFSQNRTKKIKAGFIIFIIPLFLGFALNPDSLSTQILSNKGVNITNNDLNNGVAVGDELTKLQQSDYYNEEDNSDLEDNEVKEEFINENYFNNKNYDTNSKKFKYTLMESYENLDEMIGQEIELSGFVYREPDSSKNRFVISRLLMICCAADAQVVGLLCEWDDAKGLEDNQWIKITGVFDSTTYYNKYTNEENPMALIKVTNIEHIDPPDSQYIYP